MKTVTSLVVSAMLFCCPLIISAQSLDGSPYTPGKDADISLYLNDYRDADIVITHGTLEEQAILTRGSHLNPPGKQQVLEFTKRFSRAALPPGKSTRSEKLNGEQEIFYIISGTGSIISSGKSIDLYSGICVLVPEGKNFSIVNSGTDSLTMYLIVEPVPEGFKPVKEIVVKDENTIPISNTRGHWCHITRGILNKDDGLATLNNVLTVGIDPMTIPHPHSHKGAFEEVWTCISGKTLAFIGKQIFWQGPGVGYLIPPDGNTPHSNINVSGKPAKMLYFAKY